MRPPAIDQNLVRGLFLVAVSLFFGLGALRYPSGSLAHAGPGLFPLLVSCLLFGLAVITLVQSRLRPAVPLRFDLKNIALIMLSLGGFVALSKLGSMMAGIVCLVFVATLASTSHSWKRNLQVSVGLILIALAFQKLLGLNLRLV